MAVNKQEKEDVESANPEESGGGEGADELAKLQKERDDR